LITGILLDQAREMEKVRLRNGSRAFLYPSISIVAGLEKFSATERQEQGRGDREQQKPLAVSGGAINFHLWWRAIIA